MTRRHFSDTTFSVSSATTQKARALRRALTPAELKLWQRLKGRQTGEQFRRQHPIGPFIVDFYNADAKLAIELDGPSHGGDAAEAADARRTAYLRTKGVEVLRFGNQVVHEDIGAVVDSILAEVALARLRRTAE